MKNSDYAFNVGDLVITTEGETGEIVDICRCERCRNRGWYEPMWRNDDTGEIDYITDYQAESGFVGFYRIGDHRFGRFETQRVCDKIADLKNQVEKLEGRLKFMVWTFESEKDEKPEELKKVIHAHWEPLKVYPDEFVCSYCGELWKDEKTKFCHECGAVMDEVEGD